MLSVTSGYMQALPLHSAHSSAAYVEQCHALQLTQGVSAAQPTAESLEQHPA